MKQYGKMDMASLGAGGRWETLKESSLTRSHFVERKERKGGEQTRKAASKQSFVQTGRSWLLPLGYHQTEAAASARFTSDAGTS